MKFSDKNSDVDFETDTSPQDALRSIERATGWKAEPWHFELLKTIPPERIHGFFGKAKLKDKTLYFDGKSPRGRLCFQFVKNNLRSEIYNALGNFEICKAADGEILDSFYVGETKDKGLLTRGEIKLMFDLSKRAGAGQKIDSYAELEAYRRQNVQA